ncbi:MAG: T9SS type A sorting domain-containing protein [Candidatus Krumholzibacteriota bacterium]|nr:T9SS type A sorting domain-containing protein [Candidatus Krumholzibacteriota bacterium]
MRSTSLLSCALLAVLFAAGAAQAGEVRAVYRFDAPRIEPRGGGFSALVFENTIGLGPVGEPAFPFRGARILLPEGERAASVRIERRDWTPVAGTCRLAPRQAFIPVSAPRRSDLRVNEAAYGVDRWVEPETARFRTFHYRGHPIAVGSFSPAAFHPRGGLVGWYGEIELVVETSPDPRATEAAELRRTDAETIARLSALVDNPGAAPAPADSRAEELGFERYEYLILTNETLASSFEPLRRFYNRRGIRTKIVAWESVEEVFDGIDPADNVRRAIRDAYIHNGITHVLLGGDADGHPDDPKTVPFRPLYCGFLLEGILADPTFEHDNNIPADIYFACLDGSWNDDADTAWGEPGEDDLFAEVAVGRAPVDDPAEAADFVNKTILYQSSPVAGMNRSVVLLGEKLWDEPLVYGGDCMDELVGTCVANGYETCGYPVGFAVTRRYERDGDYWYNADVCHEVNDGTLWLAHLGHSYTHYCMHLRPDQINEYTFANDGSAAPFPVFYSQGCYAGAFDNRMSSTQWDPVDCIGEIFVTTPHCAVAFIGNSRFGLADAPGTDGPNQHFMREFFDAVFSEGCNTLGEANNRSKEEVAPFLVPPDLYETGGLRWVYYCLNLLGDPVMETWTDEPNPMSVSHPILMSRGAASIVVDTGVEGALVALWADGECFARGVADAGGTATVERCRTIPDSLTSIEIDAWAHDREAYRGLVFFRDPATGADAPPPLLRLEQNEPNPFNPSTVIRFVLDRPGRALLRVYDVRGRRVATLVDGRLDAGLHAVPWRPAGAASGVYLYVLETGGRRIARKAVLLR